MKGFGEFVAVGLAGLFLLGCLAAFMNPALWGSNGGLLGTTPNQHPEYADSDGDGFVPAQGDPLYDEHYAKEVNGPNSEAKENLADAGYTDSRTRMNDRISGIALVLVVLIGLVVLGVIVTVLAGAFR